MGKIGVFNHVSVDGFFAGPNGEIDWFKFIQKDSEWDAHTHRQSQSGNALIFGRTTYEMMKSFWPTPAAIQTDPAMAKIVNESPKVVFSRTLQSVEEGPNWKHIRLLHDINPEAIRTLKAEADMTILGSGSIVQQFANLGLIDEYALAIVPVVLGGGKSFFRDVATTNLKLLDAKAFKNGIVLLRYQP